MMVDPLPELAPLVHEVCGTLMRRNDELMTLISSIQEKDPYKKKMAENIAAMQQEIRALQNAYRTQLERIQRDNVERLKAMDQTLVRPDAQTIQISTWQRGDLQKYLTDPRTSAASEKKKNKKRTRVNPDAAVPVLE